MPDTRVVRPSRPALVSPRRRKSPDLINTRSQNQLEPPHHHWHRTIRPVLLAVTLSSRSRCAEPGSFGLNSRPCAPRSSLVIENTSGRTGRMRRHMLTVRVIVLGPAVRDFAAGPEPPPVVSASCTTPGPACVRGRRRFASRRPYGSSRSSARRSKQGSAGRRNIARRTGDSTAGTGAWRQDRNQDAVAGWPCDGAGRRNRHRTLRRARQSDGCRHQASIPAGWRGWRRLHVHPLDDRFSASGCSMIPSSVRGYRSSCSVIRSVDRIGPRRPCRLTRSSRTACR